MEKTCGRTRDAINSKRGRIRVRAQRQWRATGFIALGVIMSAASCLAYAQNGDENAQANNIHITQVHTYSENELLYLDLTASIMLPAAIKEALSNGIQLSFLAEIEIYSPKRLLPDKKLAHFEIIRKLGFHALTKKFILRDLRAATNQNFNSLENALRQLGLYRGAPLTSAALSKSSPDTMMRVRIRLLQDNLPWLLYFKSRLPPWKLSSDWYAWRLN